MVRAMIAGIDLGTTNSLIGVMDAGFPVLFADATGSRLTPSVVHFAAENAPLVGTPAQRMLAVAPAETIYSIKRFMGRRASEAQEDAAELPFRFTGRGDHPVKVQAGGREWLPEEVSACVLRKLKSDVESSLGEPVTRAVITVPAYFNDAQRTATRRAGELAGWTVERIINEPTAAALAYGLDKLGEHSRIAVYDLGGGTFDLSILEIRDGVFQVIATNGNTRLGGDDIDAALVEWLLDVLPAEQRARIQTSPEALARLREAAELAKRTLSDSAEYRIDLPFLLADYHLSQPLTRTELETIARPIVERTREHCRRALADAKLSPADLNEVILVGGSTRMPLVQQLVGEIFGREPNLSQNPDEAVAIGATIQAGILSGAVRDVVLLDVTPLSLGIETFGGLMNVIIPRNSTIPTKAGEMFTNAVAGQRSMLIRILQGEREMARDNWELGKVELQFEPAPRGQARVGVQFEIDTDGILHVLARDVTTGNERRVDVCSAVDVADEQVEKMVAESIDFAFDDLNERRFTEAKMKAEEMLPAVELALDSLGDAVSTEERERVKLLAEEVRAALESKELPRLKASVKALDEATQPLAALLLDQAMEEALARKMGS